MLTTVIKTCIKKTASNEADYFALVDSVRPNLDLSQPEKLALIDESFTIIVNTDIQSEIDFLNSIDDAMIQAETSKANKITYLQKTANQGQQAFMVWRSIVFDFLFAKQTLLAADPTSTVYSDITNRSLLVTYKDFLFYFFTGMIPELKEDVIALPNTALLLKEFYPIGQTTTTVRDIYITELDKIMAG